MKFLKTHSRDSLVTVSSTVLQLTLRVGGWEGRRFGESWNSSGQMDSAPKQRWPPYWFHERVKSSWKSAALSARDTLCNLQLKQSRVWGFFFFEIPAGFTELLAVISRSIWKHEVSSWSVWWQYVALCWINNSWIGNCFFFNLKSG